ncbi:porin, partial [Thiomonas sp.]
AGTEPKPACYAAVGSIAANRFIQQSSGDASMKKSLLALAVLGAFSGAAFAQSSVQLYGIIDLGVAHYSNGNSSVTKLGTGIQAGSRIGIKGTEDLGGGLSAFFDAETGFCANGGTYASAPGNVGFCTGGNLGYGGGGGFMQRQAFAGLKGNFGAVSFGRQYTLTFLDQANIDPFGYGMTGTISNIGLIGAPARASQSIIYQSPNFSGFNVAGLYVFGDGMSSGGALTPPAGSTYNTTGQYNLHGGYNNGPIMVGVDYLRENWYNGNAAAKHTMIVGSYDFGVAKLAGMYAQNQQGTVAGTSGDKLDVWMLGATVPVGPGSILASYTAEKDKTTAGLGAKQYAIGYTYSLSKRTNLYTSYAHISNDTGAAFTVQDATGNNDALVAGTGFTSSGFALGIRHQF